jgi:hypothetical protein
LPAPPLVDVLRCERTDRLSGIKPFERVLVVAELAVEVRHGQSGAIDLGAILLREAEGIERGHVA